MWVKYSLGQFESPISVHLLINYFHEIRFDYRLQGKAFQWPLSDKQTDSSASSSIQETEDSGRDSIDSRRIPQTKIPKVKFTCDGDSISPSDSVSSVEYVFSASISTTKNETNQYSPQNFHSSSMRDAQNCSLDAIETHSDLSVNDYQDIFKHVDLCNMNHSPNQSYSNPTLSPYRKYIEHVLKSRGLGQSLSFLHRLHNVVLRKAHATLEVPRSEDSDSDFESFNDEFQTTEIPLSKEHEDELHRYGIWSEEAASLNLPSYVPAFVFLSIMPLEVMHEYLRMRLESKPVTPNPLSLEQLMKELREGLILAMTHRERYNKHIHTAFYDKEPELEKHTLILEDYDATVKNVMDVCVNEHFICFKLPKNKQNHSFYRFIWNTLNNGFWLRLPKVIGKMRWTKSGCFPN